jgi:uncharacterized membrane protein YfcA
MAAGFPCAGAGHQQAAGLRRVAVRLALFYPPQGGESGRPEAQYSDDLYRLDVGALLVQHVQSDILRQILPILVIGIGLYFLLMPKLGEEDRQRRLYGLPFALMAGGCVGFYDGFFGPGAGSFYALAFVTLAGFNLAKSTAHAKLLNATSNVGGLLLFIIGGKVIWATGFVMMAGQFIGARAGSRLVLSKGQSLIRPMIVVVSAVMSAKLLYDSHGQEFLQWLGMN